MPLQPPLLYTKMNRESGDLPKMKAILRWEVNGVRLNEQTLAIFGEGLFLVIGGVNFEMD